MRDDLNISWQSFLTPINAPGSPFNIVLVNNTIGETVRNVSVGSNVNNVVIPASALWSGNTYTLTVSTMIHGTRVEGVRSFTVGTTPFFAFYGERGWRYPLDHPNAREITAGYRSTTVHNTHEGIDIARTEAGGLIRNEPVHAAHGGIVTHNEWFGTGGNTVIIVSDVQDPDPEFPNNIRSRYMHMLWTDPSGTYHRPALNQRISMGTQIGVVYDTGGPRHQYHLHLDFSRGTTNTPSLSQMLNPFRFFPHVNFEANRFPDELRDEWRFFMP